LPIGKSITSTAAKECRGLRQDTFFEWCGSRIAVRTRQWLVRSLATSMTPVVLRSSRCRDARPPVAIEGAPLLAVDTRAVHSVPDHRPAPGGRSSPPACSAASRCSSSYKISNGIGSGTHSLPGSGGADHPQSRRRPWAVNSPCRLAVDLNQPLVG